MNEQTFWQIIDQAWNSDEGLTAFRDAVLASLESESAKESFEEGFGEEDPCIPNEDAFMAALEGSLDGLSQSDLQQFDNILERKLYDIDRQEIHEFTDGSDDGFLYCRGFIVAMGQTYYNAVNTTPSNAMFDWECEAMTYVSHFLYEKKFGEMPDSGISRETCSNSDAWSDE